MSGEVQQLRDCAELLLGAITKTDNELGPCYTVNDTGCNGLSEPYELAVAYLAEHPVDDDEPVTKDWLMSCGGIREDHPQKVSFNRHDALSVGLWIVVDGWKAMLLHSASAASCIVRGLTTRGQVRILCKSLGIELNSETAPIENKSVKKQASATAAE